MNILVIGSGGREHALCWKIAQSPLAEKVWCAPGNAGIAEDTECVALSGQAEIIAFCLEKHIGLVVIGPEQPLVEGMADALRANRIPVFGPSARAAQLEGSKGFTKDLCKKYNIPTAAYQRFDALEPALAYVKRQGAPIVVKADGLAAGKGVVVAMALEEAERALRDLFDGALGETGAVVEDYMEGEEASFFALLDGETAMEFASVQDHKRVGEGDTGPNTGGMGTYAPPPVMTETMRARTMEEIIHPTVAAMRTEGMPYQGVLFAGLMITKDGPKLIEYNARFGDPETQSMLMLLESDLVPLLMACAGGMLSEFNHTLPIPPPPAGEGKERATLAGGGGFDTDNTGKSPIRFHPGATMCVVMAAKGYPGPYEKGSAIRGLEKAGGLAGVKIFHAGTSRKDGEIVATGGRVLGITARGNSIAEARERAYKAIDAIDWPKGFCRRDIGWRALK